MTDEVSKHTAETTKALFLDGGLWAVVGSRSNKEADPQLEAQCISLHNAGEIDFLSGVDQSAFAELERFRRWPVFGFIGRVLPSLDATWEGMTQFIDRCPAANPSGVAYEIQQGAIAWFAAHPAEALKCVATAEAMDPAALPHLEPALVGHGDLALCRRLAADEDARLSVPALHALARLPHPTPQARAASVDLARQILSQEPDGIGLVLLARLVLDGLTRPGPALEPSQLSLLDEVLTKGGATTLPQAAFALCTASADTLEPGLVALLLRHLAGVDAGAAETIEGLDEGLRRLAERGMGEDALAFVETVVTGQDGGLQLGSFDGLFGSLFMGPHPPVQRLVLAWLDVGRPDLCHGLVALFQRYQWAESPLALYLADYDYDETRIWFICRRAAGYFLLHEVVAASIIVSALRTASRDLAGALTDLLIDPLLMNYQSKLRPYLEGIAEDDPAAPHIARAIEASDAYRAAASGLDIPELEPSQTRRQQARTQRADLFRSASRDAQKSSILADLVHRQTLLYGRNSLSYLTGPDGQRQVFKNELVSYGYEAELPQQDVLDPVGLAMRMYRLKAGGPG